MAGSIMAVQRNGSSRLGRSSAAPAGDLARGLGWFSIGLGTVELLAPGAVTRRLGRSVPRTSSRLPGSKLTVLSRRLGRGTSADGTSLGIIRTVRIGRPHVTLATDTTSPGSDDIASSRSRGIEGTEGS